MDVAARATGTHDDARVRVAEPTFTVTNCLPPIDFLPERHTTITNESRAQTDLHLLLLLLNLADLTPQEDDFVVHVLEVGVLMFVVVDDLVLIGQAGYQTDLAERFHVDLHLPVIHPSIHPSIPAYIY